MTSDILPSQARTQARTQAATQVQWDPASARRAGALYLAIALCGGFSIGYVPAQIVVPGDAAASAAALLAHPLLFKLGVLADSAVLLFELAITVLLYDLFRSLGPKMALFALISRFGMIGVMAINLLLWGMPYVLLNAPFAMDAALDPKLATALTAVFFAAHAMGVFVWQLFFGVHLLALGALILRSPHVPHLLGWGLLIGAFGYLLQGLAKLTFTEIALLEYTIIALLVVVTLSELSFGLWLLLRGGRRSRDPLRFAAMPEAGDI